MDCSQPPPLSEDQLSAALDGDAEPSVLEHLSLCPACAARLEQARRIEQTLKTSLFRWDCPTPQELGEYYLKHLRPQEMAAISAHLTTCVRCQTELADLQGFMDDAADGDLAVPAGALRLQPYRPRQWTAQLYSSEAAFAARGADKGPVVAQAGDVTLFLETRRDPQGITLVGQLVADTLSRWSGALVEVRQNDVLQATALIDDLGAFQCGPLLRAPVELRVAAPDGQSIVAHNVELFD